MSTTADLRRNIRQARRALGAAEHAVASRQLQEQLLASRLLHRARHVALYFPNDGEIDVTGAMLHARSLCKTFYFPVLRYGNTRNLWFVPWRHGDRLEANRFGIPEPAVGPRRLRPVWALDVIVMPLTAFDDNGNRLGMGAGYYDRSLAALGRRNHWRRPLLIGAAFDFQRVGAIKARPWDIALDGVVTPRGLTLFRGGRAIE